jgi:hypothetical protein
MVPARAFSMWRPDEDVRHSWRWRHDKDMTGRVESAVRMAMPGARLLTSAGLGQFVVARYTTEGM